VTLWFGARDSGVEIAETEKSEPVEATFVMLTLELL
jgi:hypothetical protein